MVYIFTNTTDVVAWVDEPDRRGTSGILTSCIGTMLLCVWTALHLNLPHPSSVKQRWYNNSQQWRKVRWLFLGWLAPELVVYTAWFQHREARKVMDLGIKVKDSAFDESRYDGHGAKWSMVQAFYATMGGLVIDVNGRDPFLPGQRRRMTLTPDAVKFIAKWYAEVLPDITEEDIRDRSKADALSKLIVCVQAAWFVAQSINRLASTLPITLIEVCHV